MKYLVYTFSIALLLLLCQCSKDNVSPAATDQLPAATQEGKNTFGCLVDGQVFLPTSNPLSGNVLTCAYQYINSPDYKGYFLVLSAPNQSPGANGGLSVIKTVGIYTDSLAIKEGDIIPLGKRRNGGAYGVYFIVENAMIKYNYTNDTILGELHLTKFDMSKLIASGTFWFNAIDSVSGKTIKVTDGRFDMHFSQ